MPTSKPRLQVVLDTDQADRVKALATERGLSVSAMCSQLIAAALELDRFQQLGKVKSDILKEAVDGNLNLELKMMKLLEVIEKLK